MIFGHNVLHTLHIVPSDKKFFELIARRNWGHQLITNKFFSILIVVESYSVTNLGCLESCQKFPKAYSPVFPSSKPFCRA